MEGGGRCERISDRRVESLLPAVEMKTSISKPTFLWRVENEINIILLFEICLVKYISTMRLHFSLRQKCHSRAHHVLTQLSQKISQCAAFEGRNNTTRDVGRTPWKPCLIFKPIHFPFQLKIATERMEICTFALFANSSTTRLPLCSKVSSASVNGLAPSLKFSNF